MNEVEVADKIGPDRPERGPRRNVALSVLRIKGGLESRVPKLPRNLIGRQQSIPEEEPQNLVANLVTILENTCNTFLGGS